MGYLRFKKYYKNSGKEISDNRFFKSLKSARLYADQLKSNSAAVIFFDFSYQCYGKKERRILR